jgi:Protein of unknown function (DUF1488)
MLPSVTWICITANSFYAEVANHHSGALSFPASSDLLRGSRRRETRHLDEFVNLRTLAERSRDTCSSVFRLSARWNPERSVVEFGIGVGEYEGVVRVSRRVFQILLPEAPTPERCLEAYHLHRTRLELIAERKVRRRQLTDDGNVEVTGRDLREREFQARHPRPIGYHRAAP